MYSDTITLFNFHKEKNNIFWYPTVLYHVDLSVDKAAIVARYGTESKDSASLHVKYQTINGIKMIQGKKYLPPKEWMRQPKERLTDSITFRDGQNFDFFCTGEWIDTSPINDDLYMDGFYNHMNHTRDYVFAITSVAGPYRIIPHFEIMAK